MKKWQVEVSLISSSKMRKLNQLFLNKMGVTDILSFQAPPFIFKKGFLGELVICESQLKKQAKEHGHLVSSEFKILLVHGILHLLGFEHEKNKKDAVEMRKWEKILLGGIPGLIDRSKSGIS